MPTKIVTSIVTIPVDHPEGYKPVAYRCGAVGDSVLMFDTVIEPIISATPCSMLILEKVESYQWPEFIPPGWWIAMDADEQSWWTYVAEPQSDSEQWYGGGGISVDITALNWTPPKVSDWRNSKMQKPW